VPGFPILSFSSRYSVTPTLFMVLQITRISHLPDVTFGVLSINNIPKFLTVECPWLFNQKSVSCIPAGSYFARVIKRNSAGPTIQKNFPNSEHFIIVDNVPGRSGIYFHPANTAEDVQGCVGVGLFFGELASNDKLKFLPAVLDSTHALERLIGSMIAPDSGEIIAVDEPFVLIIK